MSTRPHTTVCVCALLALCACGGPAKEAADHLSLEPPVAVEIADIYSDGGTLAVTFRDAAGKKLSFCKDGRMGMIQRGKPLELYLGVEHPERGAGEIVPPGSDIDRALFTLLQAWLDGKYSRRRQERIAEAGFSEGSEPETYKAVNALRMRDVLKRRIEQAEKDATAAPAA